MSELKTYRAREAGYVDDSFIEEGQTFTTAKPKGRWMALLDDKGNELPDPEPTPLADPSEALDAVRREVTEQAKVVFDQMRADFEEKLKAETVRADAAEKAFSDYKAEAEQLLRDADAATDKATQRAEAAEKERDALKADAEKAKTAPAAKVK
ncbi:MAG: hypothetical protein ABIV36_16085 [Sphingobium limneticum]